MSVFAFIGNTYIIIENYLYKKTYTKTLEISNVSGIVISTKEEKNYYDKYIIKAVNKEIYNKKYIIYVKKGLIDLKTGNKIHFSGVYKMPEVARNYKGFNYKEYLKTKKIYGSFQIDGNIKIIKQNVLNPVSKTIDIIREKIVSNSNKIMCKDSSSILTGIILGKKDEIPEAEKEYFRLSNMSHILSVSGMHTSYIVLGVTYILNKIPIRKKYMVTIIILLFFMALTNFSVSVVRAVIMVTMLLISKLLYKKNDFLTSIFLSLLILLIYNPFLIQDIGLQLSFLGTLGIVMFSKTICSIIDKKTSKKFSQVLSVGISAQILIIPVLVYNFNLLSIAFILSSFVSAILVGVIFIYGFLNIIVSFVSVRLAQNFSQILEILIKILRNSAKEIADIRVLNYIVKTPTFLEIFSYYTTVFLVYYLINLINKSENELRRYEKLILKKIRNTNIKKKVQLFCIIICIWVGISSLYKVVPKDLRIHFIDVGQGDSTLIITPKGKNILIDGGEDESTVLNYLLDRRITKLDYILISHLDSDHIGGIFSIMQKLKVGQVIISKQGEVTENYIHLKEIASKKKIKIIRAGITENLNSRKIQIENDIYLEILWPNNSKLISENILNNNSIVCKLCYNKFSMLFTGDIEEIAENEILQKNKNNLQILKSTILKVGHHGSKTSSSENFLKSVNPQIVLIGVGNNNKFGHPNDEVIDRLKKYGTKIYRTDKMGEISVIINKSGKIRINKTLTN